MNSFNALVNEMRPNCPHLQVLMLHHLKGVPHHAYVDLLISYKEQLTEAVVDDFDEDNLVQVASHCPNLRCILSEYGNRFDRIRAAAPITKILLLALFVDVDETISDLLTSCENLKSPYLYENRNLEDLLAEPLPKLDYLEISLLPTVSEISLVARCVARLKTIHIDRNSIDNNATMFGELAESTYMSLRNVLVVDNMRSTELRDGLEWIQGLMDHFLVKLTYLETVELKVHSKMPDVNELRAAVMPLRQKAVHLIVNFDDGPFDSHH